MTGRCAAALDEIESKLEAGCTMVFGPSNTPLFPCSPRFRAIGARWSDPFYESVAGAGPRQPALVATRPARPIRIDAESEASNGWLLVWHCDAERRGHECRTLRRGRRGARHRVKLGGLRRGASRPLLRTDRLSFAHLSPSFVRPLELLLGLSYLRCSQLNLGVDTALPSLPQLSRPRLWCITQ